MKCLCSLLDTTLKGYASKNFMQMYHENNFDICSGHYVMQVVVESQIETNSISFPFENTVHDNIYAVIN